MQGDSFRVNVRLDASNEEREKEAMLVTTGGSNALPVREVEWAYA